MTPLRRARQAKSWSLKVLSDRLLRAGLEIDVGNLSRLERGQQGASTGLAEKQALVFGESQLSEMQVLYPERYPQPKKRAA